MIAHLRGELLLKDTSHVVIDVAGVGYQVMVSASVLASLPALGEVASLWTKLIVREDDMALFGFESVGEKAFFEKLMTVSGVGPKVALAALSTLDPASMARAIEAEDVGKVSTIPGVGKKVAQRIILELKGKLDIGATSEGEDSVPHAASGDASDALLSMGFSSAEVAVALEGYQGPPEALEACITYALKRLGANK